MSDLNYQETLDKALILLRKLEIEDALRLFYQLLQQSEFDISLIDRIYALEIKRKSNSGFRKICEHIFSIPSKSKEFHQLIISTYVDYKRTIDSTFHPSQFSSRQVFNLFYHLGLTGYSTDCDKFKLVIKQQYSESPQTPLALLLYCEQLVEQNKLLLAEKELEFLLIYYAEAETTIPAERLLSIIRQRLGSTD